MSGIFDFDQTRSWSSSCVYCDIVMFVVRLVMISASFWMLSLKTGKTTSALQVLLCLIQRININKPGRWNTADNQPPRDVPPCGFFDELCSESKGSKIKAQLWQYWTMLININQYSRILGNMERYCTIWTYIVQWGFLLRHPSGHECSGTS